MSNQTILKIESLKKVFSGKKTVVALDGIDLTIARNEFVVLLGPSGCGKSTLLYIIGGLLKPSEGRVLLDGKDITGASPERGIVFQEFALYPWLTVEENIRFGLKLSASKVRDESKIRDIVRGLIKTIGLTGFEHSKPHQLSGGMKQRVALARCLATDPEVLLMDEPFGALDAQTRGVMQKELMTLFSKTKKTILFVTHSIDEAVLLADRVAVFTARPGRIKEVVPIDLPRERWNWQEEIGDDFLRKCAQLNHIIKEEIEKAMQLKG